ncbi:sodium- and chloride-dependent glycine transporter 1-like [Drosophila nasuta]|uniref:sodium- and chloride-dependent glycine transporter 1-like n=1 Tax=Drosophila nasuta TaxID=42062 RepID=UPI00295F551A|nr:sodium- and chloride-dependent glycine transporter 1-like [Drosophila nasuta]
MVYESSYETGRKPFKPDLQRGKWEKPTDFIFACCGLALKLDIFVISYWLYFDMGLFGILPYYFYMAIYMVPLLVIHSFMGQFSSSGFISAFRLSPFFKGMGYISIFLSVAALLYYAIFAVVPLIYILHSLRPTLPWSCEAMAHMKNVTTMCNFNQSDADVISSLAENSSEVMVEYAEVHIPSVLFFKQHFQANVTSLMIEEESVTMSWTMVGLSIIIWGVIAGIFKYCSDAATFGKLLRYMILTTLGIMSLCLVRFLFLPGALDGLVHYVKPHRDGMVGGTFTMVIVVLQAFGSGWGSVMSLASFNDFKTNIMGYSWVIAFGQTLAYILFGMVSFILQHYFQSISVRTYDLFVEANWVLYLSSASAMAEMEFANLWTILYYSMLLIASLVVIITQIFTVLTSLFDEFEMLRAQKERTTFIFIGLLAFFSLPFCTNHGVLFFSAVSVDSLVTYSVMHFMLIMAVLWIYGRERFQRDIEFMLGQPFASWKIFILRFIAPFFLFYTLLMGLWMAFVEHFYVTTPLLIISFILVILPILFIPGYGIYITYENTGTFYNRIRRACRPTDWYPVEMENRQQYEETLGNSDITHQLYEVTEEEVN